MAPRPLDRGSDEPLWAQLRAELLRRLEAGEFGERLPGEHAIAAQYDVSRYTVRDAVGKLRAEGILSGQRGQQARLPVAPAQPTTHLYTLSAVLQRTGAEPSAVVRELGIRTDPAIAERLGLDREAPLVHLERVRLADGAPFALERVWLPAVLAAPLLEVDFSRASLYDELRRIGVHPWMGSERLSAIVPTAAEAALLGMGRRREAALLIERQACAGDRFCEVRHTLVRGDRVEAYAEFTDRPGYELLLDGEEPTGAVSRPPARPLRLAARRADSS
ncbi:MAG TPA: GntR family transcriptional regulator [Sporichthyaceae bacterium]|nr:GntR family transcriptional regulator [Sporichthyaceae bacterium]